MKISLSAVMICLLALTTPGNAQVLDTTPLRTKTQVKKYRQILAKLQNTRVSVNWKDITLVEAVTELRAQTKLNFVVLTTKLEDLAERELSLKLTRVPAAVVVQLLAGVGDVVFQNRRGIVYVTSRADAVKKASVLALYDVRSLLYTPPDFPAPKIGISMGPPGEDEEEEPEVEQPDPEALVDLIRDATGQANWEHEGVSIKISGGKLIIRHTPAMHRKIGGVLRAL